jgi:hypothetical protein
MKRLIYLYTSISCASKQIPFDPEAPTENAYATSFYSEGRFLLLRRLVENKVFDQIDVYVESAHAPGRRDLAPGITFRVVPCIFDVQPDPGVPLWVRGGFRSWYPWLSERQGKNWILFYQAATNRGNWLFWDIVLNDLIGHNRVFDGRLHLAYRKPTNEEIFFPMNRSKRWDVMLNASHIHDRKAQWKVIRAAVAYRALFGEDLMICMPGRVTGGIMTAKIPEWIQRNNLKVHMPGMVSREALNALYNECRIYINLGSGGQNDRGGLESMRCGLPALVAYPKFFAPHVPNLVARDPEDEQLLAKDIHCLLGACLPDRAKQYRFQNGLDKVVVPQMTELFHFLQENPVPDRAAAIRRYGL